MGLLRAFYAFYRALVVTVCTHPNTGTKGENSGFCPDCGYKVRLRWNLCRCRTCGARRGVHIALDGQISPKERYCSQCGNHEYRLVQKEKIHGYELPYAALTREIDYLDQCINTGFKSSKATSNPFGKSHFDVVEGVMLRSEELF